MAAHFEYSRFHLKHNGAFEFIHVIDRLDAHTKTARFWERMKVEDVRELFEKIAPSNYTAGNPRLAATLSEIAKRFEAIAADVDYTPVIRAIWDYVAKILEPQESKRKREMLKDLNWLIQTQSPSQVLLEEEELLADFPPMEEGPLGNTHFRERLVMMAHLENPKEWETFTQEMLQIFQSLSGPLACTELARWISDRNFVRFYNKLNHFFIGEGPITLAWQGRRFLKERKGIFEEFCAIKALDANLSLLPSQIGIFKNLKELDCSRNSLQWLP